MKMFPSGCAGNRENASGARSPGSRSTPHDGRWLGLRASVRDVSRRMQEEEERQMIEAKVREAQKLESLGVLAEGSPTTSTTS